MGITERAEEAFIEAMYERDRNKEPRYPLRAPIREVVERTEIAQLDKTGRTPEYLEYLFGGKR